MAQGEPGLPPVGKMQDDMGSQPSLPGTSVDWNRHFGQLDHQMAVPLFSQAIPAETDLCLQVASEFACKPSALPA